MSWWDNWQQGAPWTGPDCANGGRCDQSIPLAVGTPITSPVNGLVLPDDSSHGFYAAFGRKAWGGEVDILTYLPAYGGWVVVDLLHFDNLNVGPGQVVQQGDQLGTSGGQTSGGTWPSDPKFSTGPHLGVGVRSYKGFTPAFDPAALLGGLSSGAIQGRAPNTADLSSLGIQWTGGLPFSLPGAEGAALASGGVMPGGVQAPAGCSIGPVQLPAWVCTWIGQPQRLLLLVGGALVLLLGAAAFLVGALAAPAAEVVGAATGQPEVSAAGAAMRAAGRGQAGHAARHAARAYRSRSQRQQRTAKPKAKAAKPKGEPAPPAEEVVYADGHRTGVMRGGRYVPDEGGSS